MTPSQVEEMFREAEAAGLIIGDLSMQAGFLHRSKMPLEKKAKALLLLFIGASVQLQQFQKRWGKESWKITEPTHL